MFPSYFIVCQTLTDVHYPYSPFTPPLPHHPPPFLHSQEATPNILSLWSAMPWWRLYASNVPPAPKQPYFTVLCAKKTTVALLEGPHSVPFPGSQMGERAREEGGGGQRGRCARSVQRALSPARRWVSAGARESGRQKGLRTAVEVPGSTGPTCSPLTRAARDMLIAKTLVHVWSATLQPAPLPHFPPL